MTMISRTFSQLNTFLETHPVTSTTVKIILIVGGGIIPIILFARSCTPPKISEYEIYENGALITEGTINNELTILIPLSTTQAIQPNKKISLEVQLIDQNGTRFLGEELTCRWGVAPIFTTDEVLETKKCIIAYWPSQHQTALSFLVQVQERRRFRPIPPILLYYQLD